MKNKKLVIGIVLLLFVVLAIVIICKYNIKASDLVNEIYNKYQKDIDSGTSYLMQSDEFKKMNENTQIQEMNSLLRLYQRDGIIKNLSYNSENKLYSFEYNYGELKGALGGVMMKAWDPMMS